MTTAGYAMFIFSWTLIIGLCVFCIRKVIRLKEAEADRIKPVYEIDTGDLGNSTEDRGKKD